MTREPILRALYPLVLLLCAALLAVGCKSVTRGAVRNGTDAPVDVTLNSAGGQSAQFSSVPPNATSDFQELPFDAEQLGGVQVDVSGNGQSGQVDLKETQDNVVVIQGDRAPSVEAQENPDNTFW